jgi:hypothetical protein
MYGAEQIGSKIKILKFRLGRFENSEPAELLVGQGAVERTREAHVYCTRKIYFYCLNGGVVGLMPRLGARLLRSQITIHDTGTELSLLQTFQTASGAHLASSSMVTGIVSSEVEADVA